MNKKDGEIMFILILGIVLFIGLGIMFSMGKGAFLIAGYNTMSKKKKSQYNTILLCKFMGKAMFLYAVSMCFFLFSELWESKIILYIGIALFSIITVFILVYSNTGNRFKR
ncbi:UNVERIFIED_CONTAM: uncharacterized protein DUF3784 [Acetivibrio alkalicellulosi]